MANEEELKPLVIVDRNLNVLAQMPITGNKVFIDDIVSHLLLKFAQNTTVIEEIKHQIPQMMSEIQDQKEAFEHTDDSVHNLREKVNGDGK